MNECDPISLSIWLLLLMNKYWDSLILQVTGTLLLSLSAPSLNLTQIGWSPTLPFEDALQIT